MNSSSSKRESQDVAPRTEESNELPIRFAGSTLGAQRHICAFFGNPEEKYRVLLPFIKEGFERGEKAFHIVSPDLREEHLQRLESAGIDIDSVAEEGHFEIRDWNEYYFPDGEFNEARLLAQWDTVLEGAVRKGYSRTRVVAHLDWPQDDVNPLLEYEANFNRTPRVRDPVICTYDLSKHSAAFIIDIMRTHPMMIIGGILQENPFYVQPEEFVRELRARATTSQASASSAA
jgi:hypothetical protein